jgi:hypothetical protein
MPWKRTAVPATSPRLVAHDAHATGIVGVVEELGVALDDPGQRGDLLASGSEVQALEHLVDPLAHEGLDRLGLRRDAQHVAVLELARAVLEARL